MRLFVVVEGHGDDSAVPILLRRIIAEHSLDIALAGRWREPRNRVIKPEHLSKVLQHARRKADAALVLIDADNDCALRLADDLRAIAAEHAKGFPVAVVLAVREFEAWFIAAADSLRGCRNLPDDLTVPANPEELASAKGWLSERMPRPYSETIDLPALAAQFDIALAEGGSRSFRKLVKEVRRLSLLVPAL